jgi:hypothetical protein
MRAGKRRQSWDKSAEGSAIRGAWTSSVPENKDFARWISCLGRSANAHAVIRTGLARTSAAPIGQAPREENHSEVHHSEVHHEYIIGEPLRPASVTLGIHWSPVCRSGDSSHPRKR